MKKSEKDLDKVIQAAWPKKAAHPQYLRIQLTGNVDEYDKMFEMKWISNTDWRRSLKDHGIDESELHKYSGRKLFLVLAENFRSRSGGGNHNPDFGKILKSADFELLKQDDIDDSPEKWVLIIDDIYTSLRHSLKGLDLLVSPPWAETLSVRDFPTFGEGKKLSTFRTAVRDEARNLQNFIDELNERQDRFQKILGELEDQPHSWVYSMRAKEITGQSTNIGKVADCLGRINSGELSQVREFASLIEQHLPKWGRNDRDPFEKRGIREWLVTLFEMYSGWWKDEVNPDAYLDQCAYFVREGLKYGGDKNYPELAHLKNWIKENLQTCILPNTVDE